MTPSSSGDGQLLEATSTKDTYPQLYTAAREKLRLWKLNENQIDEIENSGKVSDQFDVLSDKSGIVMQRNIAVGDYVNTESILFDVVDLSRVRIMIDAYETDLPFVKVGDVVSFTAVGILGKTFTAKVTYIDPVINSGTRAASVRAESQNNSGELRPEMFINARVKTTLRKGQSSLAIPRTALLWSGKRFIVYVKVPDSEFPAYEMREITIGSRMGEMYLVEVGLEAGEEIGTNGVFAIDAAAQLSGKYSMLMRPNTKTMEVPQAFREQITVLAEAYFKVKSFGLEKDKVYKQYCPMAFDDEGAFWLSETEEILNPYFGEAMLFCGEVKKTYLKGQKVFEQGGPAKQAASVHIH